MENLDSIAAAFAQCVASDSVMIESKNGGNGGRPFLKIPVEVLEE